MPAFLPTSDVDLCSNALVLLGAQAIQNLSDNNDSARICNRVYGQIRNAVFRAHPWRCLRTRALLVSTTTTTVIGGVTTFTHPVQVWPTNDTVFSYQLPPDCLKVLHTSAEDTDDWWVEGRELITTFGSTGSTAVTFGILYTSLVLDVARYDSLLAEALTACIAANIAYAVTGGKQNAQIFYQLYQAKLEEARTNDGQEGSPDILTEDDLIDVRQSGFVGVR